jgi:hypothetical protein
MVEDRGMRHADVGSDILKPQGIGTGGKKPLLRRVENRALGLRCRTPAAGGAPLAGSRGSGG